MDFGSLNRYSLAQTKLEIDRENGDGKRERARIRATWNRVTTPTNKQRLLFLPK